MLWVVDCESSQRGKRNPAPVKVVGMHGNMCLRVTCPPPLTQVWLDALNLKPERLDPEA